MTAIDTLQTESAQDQAELNEQELTDVVGGVVSAVDPIIAVKGKKPAVDMF